MNLIVGMGGLLLAVLCCAIVLLLPAAVILAIFFNSPERKGARGERIVAERLRSGLSAEYKLLNDVYLPLPDGTTTQIDHIVVSQYGVFVVETKCYKGWIFGDSKSRVWTQSLYVGRRGWLKRTAKHAFQNPIHQNYRHVCALADNLGIGKSYFHSVVVFTGDCDFKTTMPENVVFSRRAAAYIRSFNKPIIKASQVDELAAAIAEWQGTVGEERKSCHVANLKKRHSAVREGDAPACPYCGGRMVLRTRKKDGAKFYGCESYPACRGIVNIA